MANSDLVESILQSVKQTDQYNAVRRSKLYQGDTVPEQIVRTRIPSFDIPKDAIEEYEGGDETEIDEHTEAEQPVQGGTVEEDVKKNTRGHSCCG